MQPYIIPVRVKGVRDYLYRYNTSQYDLIKGLRAADVSSANPLSLISTRNISFFFMAFNTVAN